MSAALEVRIEAELGTQVSEPVRGFAAELGHAAGALAVLFYGSNLRTGSLDGVLDFYVLLPGGRERGLWPRVSYHEREIENAVLRAKVATMALATFHAAAAGETLDTTIWARFVQTSALAWTRDEAAAAEVARAVSAAAITAARLAVALGPPSGTADEYWRCLFRETYAAEFRVESSGREESILAADPTRFAGLLPLALARGGVPVEHDGARLQPLMPAAERRKLRRWWSRRRRLGKPYNMVRLVRASATFAGAARYAAWKIERHTGITVALTPWRERHPVLAAPGVLWRVWRARRALR